MMMERLQAWHPELTAIRQDIHAHPELGMEEVRTAALVAARLRDWGLAVEEGIGRFGVVATLQGRHRGQRAIGLRADMDALAILEQTGKPYASTAPGKMHACGHDGHTTMLLGAARYLAENPDFAGTVHFIFQPAEEGRGGARAMVEDGLFRRFPCDAIYGLHNAPDLPTGMFATRKGAMMAAGGFWHVTFQGSGGHGGATPHYATDATVVLGHFLLGVQTIVSRNIAPRDTGVVSVGHVGGGSTEALNVMPATVSVGGTMRCFTAEVRDILERRIEILAQTLAEAHGCTAEVRIDWVFQTLVNQPEQTDVVLDVVRDLVGPDRVNGNTAPITGGEDFADMLAERPGAFTFIGNGLDPDGSFHAVHTPLFDFNDEIIPLGCAYWVGLIERELGLQGRQAD